MASRGLSNPQIEVNNENLAIVPNTLSYQAGEGDTNVRAASGGGESTQTVHTVDAESRISMVKFQVYVTSEIDALISEWKAQPGENVVSFSEASSASTTVTRTFNGMSLMNHPERNPTADGTIELEFAGDPMVASR